MPARGRRSAKPFTRRRSAAAFRLRPPVPRMNLFPEPRPGGRSGGEAGAARGCSAPAPSRRAAGFAGVWVWMPVPALSGTSGVSQPVPAPRFADTFSPTSFYRRPFAEGLFRRPVPAPRFADTFLPTFFFRRPVPSGRRRFFLCPTERSALPPSRLCPLSSLPPLVSAPSRLCPLSALSPFRSAPFPLCPLSALPPLRSVPSPLRPVPVPFLSPSPLWAGRRFVAFFRSEG